MGCPGSVRAIAELPDYMRSKSSSYAKQGTSAHFLSEECLAKGCDPADYRGLWIAEHGVISDTHKKPDLPGDWFEVDDEMVEGVRLYVDTVNGHLKRLGNAELQIEQTVYPVPGREEDLFGTADAILYEPYGELVVFDFKYGKGVIVEVEFNDQQMYYGLGALRKILAAGEEVSQVRLVIVQPRAPHRDGPVREWIVDPQTLLDYADHIVSSSAATEAPDAPLVPDTNASDSYCRFCPAAAKCPALQGIILAEVVDAFPEDLEEGLTPTIVVGRAEVLGESPTVRLPDPNDPRELAAAKRVASMAEFWAKEVNAMVQSALEGGVKVPGFKLVRGKANRQWRDEADLERRLENKAGVKVDDIYNRKLRSPAQMEKNSKIGKKWVANHAIKPDGKITVAPDSDKRDAVPAAIEALTQIED